MPGGRIAYMKLREVLERQAGCRFRGDGDFYDSLNLIKNILRKDLWVVACMMRRLLFRRYKQLKEASSNLLWILRQRSSGVDGLRQVIEWSK
ncbi:hypothetical protein ATCC90586_009862 [Pythium insidiosum]|nr:hypothetical protein ATCC90586_009862 [Pythium insidiosum]